MYHATAAARPPAPAVVPQAPPSAPARAPTEIDSDVLAFKPSAARRPRAVVGSTAPAKKRRVEALPAPGPAPAPVSTSSSADDDALGDFFSSL